MKSETIVEETRRSISMRLGMAPPWSRLLAKKSISKDTSTISVHAFSATVESDEIEDEARVKQGGKGWWAWRRQAWSCFSLRRRRRPPLPPSSHLHNNAFALALVFFSLGALLVAGLASSVLRRSKSAGISSSPFLSFLSPSSSRNVITSYAPPRNWTSPAAAVRVVDGDTVVAAGIVVRLLGMDAPEDGQLCGRKERKWGARGRRDCGAEATRALRGLVAGRSLRCERQGTERYGRALARCFVVKRRSFFFWIPFRRSSGDGPVDVDIGEWMLEEGPRGLLPRLHQRLPRGGERGQKGEEGDLGRRV